MIRQERELKFDIACGDIAALEAHPLLRQAESSAPKHLRSVYFDTGEDDICKARAILRVRHADGRKVQTIKSSAPDTALQREEVEQPIEDDVPQLSAARGSSLERLLEQRGIWEQLVPRFEVDVERSVWTLHFDSAEIEVALDRGAIVAGAARADLCEVELELKSGDILSLYQAARRIGARIPLHFNLISKGERGYRLAQGNWGRAQKARPVDLRPGTPAGAALQAIGVDCLKHFLLNERLVRDADDAEPVHQARIAIRRLRATFTFFKRFASDEKFVFLAQELKWICDLFGEARDLDVFHSTVFAVHAKDDVVGVEKLAAEVEMRRRDAYQRLIAALASARLRELRLDIAQWLDIGDWRTAAADVARGGRDEQIEIFAARELRRRGRKLLKNAVHLNEIDDSARHRVRIAAKKLRYMAEFFQPLFAAHNAHYEKFCRRLEALQTTLGELNDRLAARRFLSRLAKDIRRRRQLKKDAPMLVAAARIRHRLARADADKLLCRAVETARKLAEAGPFEQ